MYEQGTITESLAYIFPELAESEDERIKKEIISLVQYTKGRRIDYEPRISQDDMIAWLEKQGSSSVKWQKNTLYNKPAINHSVLMNTIQGIAEGEWQGEHWFQYRWSWTLKDNDVSAWMELSDLDEQGEQKPVLDFKASNWYVSKVDGKIHDMTYNPADKVEPKFKVGDWIIDKENKEVFYISKNLANTYEIVDIEGNDYHVPHYTLEEDYDVWSIQDAKDGDVLINKNYMGESPFVFKETKPSNIKTDVPNPLTVLGYCGIGGAGFTKSSGWGDTANCIYYPATQEQRDTLMKAMTDAGYTFDFKKKKLKKIEDEIEIPFGAKDSELIEERYYIPKGFHAEIDDDKVVIKKGEKSAAWSNEDEKMANDLIKGFQSPVKVYNLVHTSKEIADWLKSIKNRVQPQPKQEWSEEDELVVLSIEQVIQCASFLNLVPEKLDKIDKWLKSLKERITWKPSKEQIEALDDALNERGFDYNYLNSLYEQLKKL